MFKFQCLRWTEIFFCLNFLSPQSSMGWIKTEWMSCAVISSLPSSIISKSCRQDVHVWEQSPSPGDSEIIEKFKVVKWKDEMVKVDEYVRVNPDIKFEIEGPKSGHLNDNRTRMQIVSSGKDVLKADFPVARFDFHQGSGQLSEIHFMLQ